MDKANVLSSFTDLDTREVPSDFVLNGFKSMNRISAVFNT
jgi:hypothetical protein